MGLSKHRWDKSQHAMAKENGEFLFALAIDGKHRPEGSGERHAISYDGPCSKKWAKRIEKLIAAMMKENATKVAVVPAQHPA